MKDVVEVYGVLLWDNAGFRPSREEEEEEKWCRLLLVSRIPSELWFVSGSFGAARCVKR